MTSDQPLFYLALSGYLLGTLHYLLFVVSPNRRVAAVATAMTLAGFAAHTLSFLVRIYALSGRRSAAPMRVCRSSCGHRAGLSSLRVPLPEPDHGRLRAAAGRPFRVGRGGPSAPDRRAGAHAPGNRPVVAHRAGLLGNAAFALTCCAGVMYLIQERQLKSRHPGRLTFRATAPGPSGRRGGQVGPVRVPPAHAGLDQRIGLGRTRPGNLLYAAPPRDLSILSWLTYAGLLYARVSAGWRGRKAAVLAILGFCFVLFAFLGVTVFRGWALL